MSPMSPFCDCSEDGYCPRYRRTMSGRLREICAGVNCDLGTAAAFRDQWAREAGAPNKKCTCWGVDTYGKGAPAVFCPKCNGTGYVKCVPESPPISLLLKTNQAPGDAVAMTAAIYSLHRAHPGKYVTAVESPYPEVFAHNPDVVQDRYPPVGSLLLEMHYPAIHDSNKRGIHFMQGWCEFLGMALQTHVPLLTNRPHLYFNYEQPPTNEYWVVCSGGKNDLTNKLWGFHRYAKVLYLLPNITFVQVGANHKDHPRLSGAHDLVGKTNLRQLFDLVRCARGVVCGVSLLMHVAAALEKPAIVIAGGREPVQWNAYPKQQYLHTVGALGCSSPQGEIGGACWRSRVIPLGDNVIMDSNLCERPVDGVPECMRLITPERVAELVLMYNRQYDDNL